MKRKSVVITMLSILSSVLPMKGYCDYLLLPTPQQLSYSKGQFSPAGSPDIRIDSPSYPELLETAEIVVDSLQSAAYSAQVTTAKGTQMAGAISINPDQVKEVDGYRLTISPRQIQIVANSPAGAFYAAQTLRQICQQAEPGRLTCLTVTDWPDYPNRGIMLDISRDKVPAMETLYKLVDLLASWKINQLQLYTEHTFAYSNHRTVWEDASPMTAQQIRELDAYCKQRYIELVPNQNSFGHMERWIKHDAYRHLSENPAGGHTLDPTNPESIELMSELFDELLPNFSSRQLNVGCDEVRIGEHRSKAACDEKGKGQVYLEYLKNINELCRKHGRTMQFWGDIINHHPELIPDLPKNIVAMVWGYQAAHPFATICPRFKKAGVPFYVCPGTSSWCAILGRTDNAMANLLNAAENGLKNGAIGYLNTDWGDGGHWQYLPVSYPGFAYGAALSWAVEKNRDVDVAGALDLFVFRDSAGVMGELMLDLGNAHLKAGKKVHNSVAFFYILKHLRHRMKGFPDGFTAEGFQATIEEIDRVMERLPQADMRCDDADLIKAEVENGAELAKLVCRIADTFLGEAHDSADIDKNKAEMIISEHKRLWLSRNRPGGLSDSVNKMNGVSSLLNLKDGKPFESVRAEWGIPMEIINNGDGKCQSVEIAGRKAWKADGLYLYFKASQQNQPMGARVQVLYYDEGFGTIDLVYDSTAKPWQMSSSKIVRGDSKQWKVVAIDLPDATFSKRCNGGDLRLQSSGAVIGGVYAVETLPGTDTDRI